MPKHSAISLRLTDDKENSAPSAASRRRRDADDEDDARRLKRERSSSSKERYGSSSSVGGLQSSYDAESKPSRKQDRHHKASSSTHVRSRRDEADEGLGGYGGERGSASKHRQKDEVLQELEDVQAQFDELRELRITAPEQLLTEWQRDAERTTKATEEYIAALKRQHDEHRDGRCSLHTTSNGKDLQLHLQEAQAREVRLQEQIAKQARELESLRRQVGSSTSTLANRAGVGSGYMLGAGDERAVRRLYEDLTGIVVNKVERVEGHEDFRRFHAIFACAGYHDLEIKLDESTSDLPSSVSTTKLGEPREDLVYTPTLDEDRDAELLESGKLPAFLKDSIRFERATAVKFLSTLHKRLDRHSKR
jgi:hypothetical protein